MGACLSAYRPRWYTEIVPLRTLGGTTNPYPYGEGPSTLWCAGSMQFIQTASVCLWKARTFCRHCCIRKASPKLKFRGRTFLGAAWNNRLLHFQVLSIYTVLFGKICHWHKLQAVNLSCKKAIRHRLWLSYWRTLEWILRVMSMLTWCLLGADFLEPNQVRLVVVKLRRFVDIHRPVTGIFSLHWNKGQTLFDNRHSLTEAKLHISAFEDLNKDI